MNYFVGKGAWAILVENGKMKGSRGTAEESERVSCRTRSTRKPISAQSKYIKWRQEGIAEVSCISTYMQRCIDLYLAWVYIYGSEIQTVTWKSVCFAGSCTRNDETHAGLSVVALHI